MKPQLLTREQFREGCLKRDSHQCVICHAKEDIVVHHIVDRRLYSGVNELGGYFLENGSSLCSECHIKAEQTVLTCEEIRLACGIDKIILPEHAYEGERYDKWLNSYLSNGQRSKGELYDDESVQKILPDYIKAQFSDRIKYPRTMHLPFSEGASDDDRMMSDCGYFEGKEVVVSLKMDGECSGSGKDGNDAIYFHARSIDSDNDLSRNWAKNHLLNKLWELPRHWRIHGENLFAKHSIEYNNLSTYFYMFSIWNEKNICLSWNETVEWSQLLGLELVPILYEGIWDDKLIRSLYREKDSNGNFMEGYVVRLKESFHYSKFKNSVGKFVSAKFKNQLKADNPHWKRTWVKNGELV